MASREEVLNWVTEVALECGRSEAYELRAAAGIDGGSWGASDFDRVEMKAYLDGILGDREED